MEFDINSAKVVEDNEPQFDINSAADINETEIILDPETDTTIEAPIGLKPKEITYLHAVQNKKEKPNDWLAGVKVKEPEQTRTFWDKVVDTTNRLSLFPQTSKTIVRSAESLKESVTSVPDVLQVAVAESKPETLAASQLEEPNIIELAANAPTTLYNYIANSVAPEDFTEATNKAKENLKKSIQTQERIASQIPDDRFLRNVFKATQAVGQTGLSIVPALITKNAGVGARMFALLQASDTYKEQRQAGVEPNEALLRASTDAAVAKYTEGLGLQYTLSNLVGVKKFITKTLLEGANNAAQEFVQSVANDAINQNIRKQTISDIFENAIESSLFGAGVGTTFGALANIKNPLESAEYKKALAKQYNAPVEVVDAVVNKVIEHKQDIAQQILDAENDSSSDILIPDESDKITELAKAALDDVPMQEVVAKLDEGSTIGEALSYAKSVKAAEAARAEQQKIISDLEAEAQAISEREADLMQPEIKDTDPEVIKARINKLDSDLAALDDRINAQQDIISERFKAGKSTKAVENKLDKLLTQRETIATELAGLETADRRNVTKTAEGKGISEQTVVAAESPIRNLIKGIRNKKFIQQGTVDTLKKELIKRVNDYLKSNPGLKENFKDKFQTALEGIKNFDDLKRKAAMLDSVLSRAERSLRQPTAEDDYQRVASFKKPNVLIRAGESITDTMSKIGRVFDNALAPVSGVLRRIDPKLKAMLREYEFSHFDKANEWARMNETWFKRVSKLPDSIKNQLDFAMKNGDAGKINEIIKEYDLEAEFTDLRKTLDNIIGELNDAGVKVPYRENYYPRSIKDIPAFMEYIRMQEGWAYLSEAIDKKEIELGRPMTEEEMAQFLNNYMRYGAEDIKKTDIKFAQTKERSIERITPEMNQFYQDSDQALLMYFKSAAHAISAAKFFGKGNIEKIGTNLEASIGKFILDKMANGELTPAEAQRVAEILRARFKEAKMYELMGAVKNLGYATTMGQLSSAITQIGDLGLAVYRNGFMRSAVGLGKSLVGAKRLTVQDIGVQNILQEFSDNTFSSKVLDVVFRANLLRYVDRLGKETIINGSLSKFRTLAKKPTNQFLDDMDLIFGDRAEQVMDELKSGQTTEGVKLLVFNDLLENQPVTESEMPLYYLKHPNGRIFYMLKTYTLKVFDIYRNDVVDLARTDPKQAVTNFTRLTVLLAIAGAAASELKDWLAGEDVDFSDNVISSLLSIMGISKWDIITAKKDSVTKAIVQKVAPPTRLGEVVEQAITGDERAIKAVPVVGKIIYDQKTPEERRREKQKEKSRVELIENN